MRFVQESVIRAAPERVFAFHEQAGALTLSITDMKSRVDGVKERGRMMERVAPAGSSEGSTPQIAQKLNPRIVVSSSSLLPPSSFEDLCLLTL